MPRLHVVTDAAILLDPEFVPRARSVLEAGGRHIALHLRAPGVTLRSFLPVAEMMRAETREAGAVLIVNDRIDVALAVDADGVQLGHRSIPPMAARPLLRTRGMGASVHGAAEAKRAQESGTDWVVLGTIYASRSHPGGPIPGTSMLAQAVADVRIPVLAIGGLAPTRVREVMAAGAFGVAVVSGIWHDPAPARATRAFIEAIAAYDAGPEMGGEQDGDDTSDGER